MVADDCKQSCGTLVPWMDVSTFIEELETELCCHLRTKWALGLTLWKRSRWWPPAHRRPLRSFWCRAGSSICRIGWPGLDEPLAGTTDLDTGKKCIIGFIFSLRLFFIPLGGPKVFLSGSIYHCSCHLIPTNNNHFKACPIGFELRACPDTRGSFETGGSFQNSLAWRSWVRIVSIIRSQSTCSCHEMPRMLIIGCGWWKKIFRKEGFVFCRPGPE